MKNSTNIKENWTKEFKLETNGHVILFVAEVILKEKINFDGDVDVFDCCKESLKCYIDGSNTFASFIVYREPREISGTLIYGEFGPLRLGKKNFEKVIALKNEMENHPDVKAKIQKIAENRKEIEEAEKNNRRNGLCSKCGTYCYGDCEAN